MNEIAKNSKFKNQHSSIVNPRITLQPSPFLLASIALMEYDIAIDMTTVTVSPKFQVVIPRAVRAQLKLAAGEELQVIPYGDRIELIPVRPIKSMRGFLRGMDASIEREQDRML